MVVDGVPGTSHTWEPAILVGMGSPMYGRPCVFSPDGAHYAYTTCASDVPAIVLDGELIRVQGNEVYAPLFAPNGALTYMIRDAGTVTDRQFVLGEKQWNLPESVQEIVLSEDLDHIAVAGLETGEEADSLEYWLDGKLLEDGAEKQWPHVFGAGNEFVWVADHDTGRFRRVERHASRVEAASAQHAPSSLQVREIDSRWALCTATDELLPIDDYLEPEYSPAHEGRDVYLVRIARQWYRVDVHYD